MKAVVQRVTRADVAVGMTTVAEIGRGFMILVGVAATDEDADASWVADKVAGLRIFEDEDGRMNLALADIAGSVLLVSQFTLLADTRRGRRPSFADAAPPERAEALYATVARELATRGISVRTGAFGEHMAVSLTNDGPATILLDSAERHRPRRG